MRGGRLKRDILVNVSLTGVKVVTLMWVVRLAGLLFTPANLGLFLLARRLSSTAANLLGLGAPQTLLRYVPMNISDPARKRAYVAVAVEVWIALALLIVPVSYALRGLLAAWAFPGTQGTGPLAFWSCGLTMTTTLGFIVYSTLLAERRMVSANLVELMSSSGFLFAVLAWQGKDATPVSALGFQAVGTVGLAALMLALYLAGTSGGGAGAPARMDTLRVFAGYGLPRAAMTFLEMALLLAGPWLMRGELGEAGYLLIALVPVQMVQIGIGPVAQVASVAAARAIGAGSSVAEQVRLLFGGLVYVTALGVAVLVPWAPRLLQIWLGDPRLVAGVSRHLAVLAWGILPLGLFQGLKGMIDACWFRPLNLYSLLLGGATQGSVFLLLQPRVGVVDAALLSLVAALWALGLATLRWLGPPYLRPLRQWGLGRLAVVSLGLLALNAAAERELGLGGLVPAAAASAAASVVCLGLLSPAPIVRSLRAFLWPRASLSSGT